ncbi:hypothetical protein AB5I41_20480 [Sphingomonas sp. MMS24-JH45]
MVDALGVRAAPSPASYIVLGFRADGQYWSSRCSPRCREGGSSPT